VLGQRAFWGSIVAVVGVPSVLAGVAIVANVGNTHHTYGWTLILIGVACVVVGGAGYFALCNGNEGGTTVNAETGVVAASHG